MAANRDPNASRHHAVEQKKIGEVVAAARDHERSMGSTISHLEAEIARLEAIIANASIPERRAVAISHAIDGLSRRTAAVCDDGSLWVLNHERTYDGWERLPGIPQPVNEMEKSGHGE
jgi:hypothetical protein